MLGRPHRSADQRSRWAKDGERRNDRLRRTRRFRRIGPDGARRHLLQQLDVSASAPRHIAKSSAARKKHSRKSEGFHSGRESHLIDRSRIASEREVAANMPVLKIHGHSRRLRAISERGMNRSDSEAESEDAFSWSIAIIRRKAMMMQ